MRWPQRPSWRRKNRPRNSLRRARGKDREAETESRGDDLDDKVEIAPVEEQQHRRGRDEDELKDRAERAIAQDRDLAELQADGLDDDRRNQQQDAGSSDQGHGDQRQAVHRVAGEALAGLLDLVERAMRGDGREILLVALEKAGLELDDERRQRRHQQQRGNEHRAVVEGRVAQAVADLLADRRKPEGDFVDPDARRAEQSAEAQRPIAPQALPAASVKTPRGLVTGWGKVAINAADEAEEDRGQAAVKANAMADGAPAEQGDADACRPAR